MRKFLIVMLMLITLPLTACLSKSEETYDGGVIMLSEKSDSATISQVISPAVVAVSGISGNSESIGSGVCVASGGYILTNSHVINGCEDIKVYLSDKTNANAEILYEDTVLDLAILKVNKSIPYLVMGDSDSVEVGEDILAVGTPLSLTLTHTFTKGIVSAINRTIKVSSSEGSGYMHSLIQHDASLNPGNSGGPLINSSGEVIGINTLKISGGEGIGFAIPSKSFISLINNFVTNINYKVPYLGVYGYDCEIANYYDKCEGNEGFYIIDIAEDSPLREVNISSGAVILSINDSKVANALDLRDSLYRASSNDSVGIEYSMAGKIYRTKVKLR